MEKLVQYLVYKKNPLRQLGVIGLKASHLEADPDKNKDILNKVKNRFSDLHQMSDADRSLAQFMCQEALFSNQLQKVTSWIIFALAAPAVFVMFILKSFKKSETTKCDVFIFRLGDLDYVKIDFPNKLIKCVPENSSVGNYLGSEELKFFLKLLLINPIYFLHPKLIVNVLRWLSMYGWVIKHYNPQVIATFFEGTASCSILTAYLNLRKIKHYNYAHGEHFRYECYSAFANFDRYTIWGEHFKKIQIEKHERSEMFVTRAPALFKYFYNEIRLLPKKNYKQITVLIHSGVEKNTSEYEALVSLLLQLEDGWKVLLRPHPVDRASWPQVMLDLKQDMLDKSKHILISSELPEEIPMKESVTRSSVFVGSASAALLEALLAGCKIIYLPGRAKNKDIIERHQNSKNVLAFKDSSELDIKRFFSEAYSNEPAEENKIQYLFDLK